MTDQTYADRVKDANDEQFRRIVGIKRTTFQAMVELVDEDYRQVHQRHHAHQTPPRPSNATKLAKSFAT